MESGFSSVSASLIAVCLLPSFDTDVIVLLALLVVWLLRLRWCALAFVPVPLVAVGVG